MADVAEVDRDVALQRQSSDYIRDIETALEPFLWKRKSGATPQIRRRVRAQLLDVLVNLLEHFQELPQLLDPHLDKFVPALANAFLAYLREPRPRHPKENQHLLVPLSKAICKLLYTFCKIRGGKVIVRFFGTETRHLELLLSAIERGSQEGGESLEWDWEERYITLLWLSQLLLAPFDLASISSGPEDTVPPEIPGLAWPSNVPSITSRVVCLAIRYLPSSSKERDSAKVLLVRVAMRRDMQQIGMLKALVQWAISRLEPLSHLPNAPPYYYIGLLSFIAGALNSSLTTSDMNPYLERLLRIMGDVQDGTTTVFKAINTNAVAQKTVIKIYRTMALLIIPERSLLDGVGNIIGYLLESLTHPATPVRLAASKALSIITFKLNPALASDVISNVLETLQTNVLWNKGIDGKRTRDVSRVNPEEWHGLILTLSHLLYRQAIPSQHLASVLNALRLGLSFEQRSSTGSSIGTNVRDAACFGIWAMARRYTTAELRSLILKSGMLDFAAQQDDANGSALQILATELVVSASLDPAGNIRRGSSAALQELIGRHPNTIEEGIQVVQVVDYHAVALRSRAVEDVAIKAAALSDFYHRGLFDALLGWRGIRDSDASTRRVTAEALGKLVWAKRMRSPSPWPEFRQAISLIGQKLRRLTLREVDERHGLISALATVATQFSRQYCSSNDPDLHSEAGDSRTLAYIVSDFKEHLIWILQDVKKLYKSTNRILTAEATSRLIQACNFLLWSECLYGADRTRADSLISPTIHPTFSGSTPLEILDAIGAMNELYHLGHPPAQELLQLECELVDEFLSLDDVSVSPIVSSTAVDSILLLSKEHRDRIIISWLHTARKAGSAGKGRTIFHTLLKVFTLLEVSPSTSNTWRGDIVSAIREHWETAKDVESRSMILSCFPGSYALYDDPMDMAEFIADGLDDYTRNARGDVGSLVRIEAARAAKAMWRTNSQDKPRVELYTKLFGRIMRLASEKLDRVRTEGKLALPPGMLSSSQEERLYSLTHNEQAYFRLLLEIQSTVISKGPNDRLSLLDIDNWTIEFLEGYLTSAGSGSEDLIRVSRAALVEFCVESKANNNIVQATIHKIMKKHVLNDRILLPSLEILAFLFDMKLYSFTDTSIPCPNKTELGELYDISEEVIMGGRTKNMRRLEAVTKLYGSMCAAGYEEAREGLLKLLGHRYLSIRRSVAEEIWVSRGIGKGVDWEKLKGVELRDATKKLRRDDEGDVAIEHRRTLLRHS